ncbi:MAG: MBL fold metallo-hydrolase [Archaeoglobaceae archaeon]|nr:MBL fold metallo-hydrolase [Archaeoglobaceae archaeon]MCX8152336.1 MBL fold metallo-hydrolase [Archaeoglobaceae archaeon]MDW8013636.1 MBL fold metallo-hydrolase [Archaeoglobaceae archaeon]
MKVTFLGTGVSVPFENRAQSSILIEDDVKLLIDAGIGAMLRLEQAKVDVCEVDAICITHHHLDHNGDLLNILKAMWLRDCKEISIFGPPGTKFFMESILEAYSYLRNKLKFKVFEEEEFKVGSIKFKAIKTLHSIESRGYVVDGVVAISGDTRAFKDFMEVDCEVIVHELSLPFGYKADHHTTPENLKENLRFCKAKKIYLTHLYPQTHALKEKILEFLEFDAKIANDLESFKI